MIKGDVKSDSYLENEHHNEPAENAGAYDAKVIEKTVGKETKFESFQKKTEVQKLKKTNLPRNKKLTPQIDNRFWNHHHPIVSLYPWLFMEGFLHNSTGKFGKPEYLYRIDYLVDNTYYKSEKLTDFPPTEKADAVYKVIIESISKKTRNWNRNKHFSKGINNFKVKMD